MSVSIKKASGFGAMLVFLSWCLGQGCYENVDGCQDITAANFSASADIPCEDCCTYPELKLVVRHRTDTLTLSPSRKVYNGVGDTFKIIQAALLLHNFQFQQAGGVLTVTNTNSFSFENGGALEEQTKRDDFAGLRNSTNNYTIGNHQGQNTVSNVSFTVGLADDFANLSPFGLSTSHALDSSSVFWQEAIGYSGGFLEVVYDTMTMDTVRYTLPADLDYSFQMDTSFAVEYGANLELDVYIDYLLWTTGINFVEIGANEDQVVQAIVNNLPNAISLAD